MRISDWSSDVCSSDLDHEINLGRLREFRAELDDSLDRKRVTVMHNQRSISSKSDRAQRLQGIQALSIEDLVNCEMFFRQNSADVDAIAKTLISKGGPDGFRVLHHIFPASPRSEENTSELQSLMRQ